MYHDVEVKPPNCEANWQKRINGPPIPWDKIWPTLGTPLSDATEERNWRKMLHRALFVRNRDPKAPIPQVKTYVLGSVDEKRVMRWRRGLTHWATF